MTKALIGIDMSNEELLLKIFEVGREQEIIFSRKKFQTIFYFLKRKFNVHFNFKFRRHLFGLYSNELEESLSFLISLEYVERCSLNSEFGSYEYKLTDEGIRAASDIELPLEAKETLRLEIPKLVTCK